MGTSKRNREVSIGLRALTSCALVSGERQPPVIKRGRSRRDLTRSQEGLLLKRRVSVLERAEHDEPRERARVGVHLRAPRRAERAPIPS